MSAADRFRPADHERARELAAARVDEVLPPADEAWLADHLEACAACAQVAAEYDAQHELFSGLREAMPEAPRDLWARTAAAIEAQGGRRSRTRGWRRLFGAPRRASRLMLAPVAVVAAVVIVVGAGLLNGNLFVPGAGPAATPIALAAADLQVISRDSSGNLQVLTRPVDQVCPVTNPSCGVSPTFSVTSVSDLNTATKVQGLISPKQDRMVVVATGPSGQTLYVAPVTVAPTASPAASTAPSAAVSAPATGPVASSTPSAPPSTAPASSTPPTPAPVTSPPATTPPATPVGTSSPEASAPASSPTAAGSASPSGSDGAVASTPPSSASPLPSTEVSPAPAAAIKIASGITIVGMPVYAPDGTHLAFSAMPLDGSTGPDVYTWTVGDTEASPITSDHGSWLAGWAANGILVSRVVSGVPATYLLDPATGHATPIGSTGVWLPAVSPTGSVAVWWSGTVKLAADGVSWVPDEGRLVLGSWPTADGGASAQALAKGQLGAWQARWDDTGTVIAVWTAASATGHDGKLSLYSVDPTTGAADLANPMLDSVPAGSDFSLRAGRLVWTTPSQGGAQVGEILAWSGKTVIGRLEFATDGSTVVP